MKKMILSIVSAGAIFVAMNSAYATPVNQQAIAGKVSSVQQVKALKDDTIVQLKGKIVRDLGNEKYEFKDQTGNIVVEIDHELWHGKPLHANQPVTLIGEVDVEYQPLKKVEIDVQQLKF
ncbi:NirD/YgiW/YdeI family stress tolerance protein [Acinetobacter qingfengensis]|uniref:Uncharacterized protein n=1 Tax=Acinetobacter qingfengensis TaxID=1262585 RepID=A0A1E7RD81_9GAMM|nr:NirD/YgiW/YdeI family stress tolerance protein [Acinetobacter qingfengensis]KAA8732156.1 NirD/YgiW/YdeI family stress tolerance protein [Acinetobacter qingfengensis]OEY97236.1 hypothetical protein BJI46_02085 [Acinetobacter qingfengensis]